MNVSRSAVRGRIAQALSGLSASTEFALASFGFRAFRSDLTLGGRWHLDGFDAPTNDLLSRLFCLARYWFVQFDFIREFYVFAWSEAAPFTLRRVASLTVACVIIAPKSVDPDSYPDTRSYAPGLAGIECRSCIFALSAHPLEWTGGTCDRAVRECA